MMIVHVLNGNSEEYGLVKRGYFLPASKNGVSDIIKGYCSLFPGDYVPKNPLGQWTHSISMQYICKIYNYSTKRLLIYKVTSITYIKHNITAISTHTTTHIDTYTYQLRSGCPIPLSPVRL